jgi:tetratricopeptide (TPR) repeat protein
MNAANFNEASNCGRYSAVDFQDYWADQLPTEKRTALDEHLLATGCLDCFEQLNNWAPLNTVPADLMLYSQQLTRVIQTFVQNLQASFYQINELEQDLQALPDLPDFQAISENLQQIAHEFETLKTQIPPFCPQWEDRNFFNYWFGLQQSKEREVLNEHLQVCAACAERFRMINRIFNRLQDHHDHQLRFLTKQIQQLETEQQQLESEQAKLALGQAKLSSEQEKLAAKQVKQQVENHHRRRQLQSYANNVRLIAQRAQILSHETQQALMKLATAHEQLTTAHEQLANSHEQLAESHQQLHQAHEQTSTTVANLVTKVSRLQQILEAVANTDATNLSVANLSVVNNDVADLDVANSFKPETPSLDTVRLSNQQARPTQLGFATITDDLPIDSATTNSSTVSNLPTPSDLPAVSRPASENENDNENNFLPATKAPTKLLTKETPMLDAALNLDTTLNPAAVLNPNPVANDAEITVAPAKLRSRAFLKVAAAVLLGTLVVAPLAYYQFQPGGDGNNSRAGVDLPTTQQKADKNGEKNLLTEEAIKEIETLVKDLQLEKAQALLTPALQQAYLSDNKPVFSKLLYLQSRLLSEKSDFFGAVANLKQSIDIAKSINNHALLLSPTLLLANIYHVMDDNESAAEQARNSLSLAIENKSVPHQIVSMQTLALSVATTNKSSAADRLLVQSIDLAQQNKDFYRVVYGYTYLGILKTERRQFSEASSWFKKALETINLNNDQQSQTYLQHIVNGYYARSQALAGNRTKAINLYRIAIAAAKQAGVQQYLALSQLHYGLAECLQAEGKLLDAEHNLAKSEVLEEEAHKRCELNNTILSFALKRRQSKRCE